MADVKLASAGDDIKLWDCSSYSMIKQFNPHGKQNVSSLCWSRDNSIVASASTGGDKISLTYTASEANSYDVARGESRTCVAFNSLSRYILGGGPDGIIHIWDLKSKKLKKSYRDHKGPITAVQFNWNDTDIASGSESGEIILYNVVSGHGCTPLTTPRVQAIRQLVYSHFKKSLLGSVSEDGAINLWDTNRRSLIHSFSDNHKAPATGLAFSPLNEMLLMSVGLDKRIICYDVQRHTAVKTMMAESPLTSVDLMSDGSTIAVGSTRGKIFIYDLRKGPSPVRTMTAHKSSVQCLKFQHKNKGDVGGVPLTRGSSLKKSNTNNNTTAASKLPSRKTTNDVQSTDTHTDLNGGTPQVLDSKNNNRVETLNSNKETPEYDTLFSSIRDTNSSPPYVSTARTPGDAVADSEMRGTNQVNNLSLENYGDGLYSPLSDSGAFSRQTHIQSNQSQHVSPQGLGFSDQSFSGHTPALSKYNMDSPPTTSSYETREVPSHAKPTYRTPGTGTQHLIRTTDQTDVRHSQSEPTITAPPRDHVTRSASSPMARVTPEADAGATGLPQEVPSPATTPPGATAAAAALDTTKHRSRSRFESGANPTSSFQMDMVRSMIDEALEDFRDQTRRDVLNLHMDILKQFQIQQAEIRTLLQQYSVNEELMTEIERLREENEKLKKKF